MERGNRYRITCHQHHAADYNSLTMIRALHNLRRRRIHKERLSMRPPRAAAAAMHVAATGMMWWTPNPPARRRSPTPAWTADMKAKRTRRRPTYTGDKNWQMGLSAMLSSFKWSKSLRKKIRWRRRRPKRRRRRENSRRRGWRPRKPWRKRNGRKTAPALQRIKIHNKQSFSCLLKRMKNKNLCRRRL